MSQTSALWLGETRHNELGFPFVFKFELVAEDAPTIVFIPGKFSLARVFYGGHDGCDPRDFANYWVREAGYNFLAISYPIYGPKGVFNEPHPDMTTQAWGRGSAMLTKKILADNGVYGPVILAAWSMGGKSVQPFASEARKLGLDLSFFAGLAATPPIHGQYKLPPLTETDLDGFGLVAQPEGAPFATRGMERAAKANGRDVIPLEFQNQYLGSTPVQLGAAGLRYEKGRGVYEDTWADIQDNRGFDFSAYPICAPIIPSLQFDPRHGLTDEHAWGLFTTTRLFQLAGPLPKFVAMDPDAFQELKSLVRSVPGNLAREVAGDHFFFIGEKGARATIKSIGEQYGQVKRIKQEFAEITGQPLESIAF